MTTGKKEPVDTLLLSDIHLGLDLARPEEIKKTLGKYDFNRLIILGDFFDNPASYIDFEERNLLDYIKEIAKKKETVWVHGNHDDGISEHFAPKLGVALRQEYEWGYKNEKFLAIHGHQFDDFIPHHEYITEMASALLPYVKVKVLVKDSDALTKAREGFQRRGLPVDSIEFFVGYRLPSA